MSKTSLYLFPFKLSSSGEVVDGSMQSLPSFCRSRCKTKKCIEFYESICGVEGSHKCPFGFSVIVEEIGGTNVIFTGLNVVGSSDKKLVQKRALKKDYVPRLTKEQYSYMLGKMKDSVASLDDYYSHKQTTLLAADDYQSKIDTLDNTFHELRKLNGRLKATVERLVVQLDTPDYQQDLYLLKAAKDVFAASQLITIRLSTYDLILNPGSSLNFARSPLSIYKKFDKVARLLDYQAQGSGTIIRIIGSSYSTFECSDMVELLPYLLLDNAIKYTMWGKDITLRFEEQGNKLIVHVISFSQRPAECELNSLLERGIRSKNISDKTIGQGLGLYLARYICDANNISIKLSLGKRIESDNDGIKYSDFIVTLQFNGIVKSVISI